MDKPINDEYVMYLIVRESLGMSPGKIGAQCGHAVQIATLRYFKELRAALNDQNVEPKHSAIKKVRNDFDNWLSQPFTKVTLKADDKEWAKVKKEFFTDAIVSCSLVVDAGRTEIEPGSETVMALWPMKRSEVPKLIKRLQLLK